MHPLVKAREGLAMVALLQSLSCAADSPDAPSGSTGTSNSTVSSTLTTDATGSTGSTGAADSVTEGASTGSGRTGGTEAGTDTDDPPVGGCDRARACLDGPKVTGDQSFTTTAELAALEGVRCIDGDLAISQSTIDSLYPLAALEYVCGNLTIRLSPELSTLSGLENLLWVEGELHLESNPKLASLAALSAIRHVGGLEIISLPISSLESLTKITKIPKDLIIENCGALTNLHGLHEIQSVSGRLNITGNAGLIDLFGLAKITELGDLTIASCSKLQSLAGLDSAGSARSILLSANPSLADLSALSAVTQLVGNLELYYLASLTDLSGLDGLTAVQGSVVLEKLSALGTLSGLDGLMEIGGDLRITGNQSLVAVDGLEALAAIENTLTIESNAVLVELTGLGNLGSVGKNLVIILNPELPNADALAFAENVSVCGYRKVDGNKDAPPNTADCPWQADTVCDEQNTLCPLGSDLADCDPNVMTTGDPPGANCSAGSSTTG